VTRILLSGLPGGGKTTLGHTLAADHGFLHADMEALYRQQLGRITQARIVESIDWRIVDPFRPDGTFRPVGEVAADIIKVALPRETSPGQR
jgi:dephospho-CoA kinase